jgi:hypothetical protein
MSVSLALSFAALRNRFAHFPVAHSGLRLRARRAIRVRDLGGGYGSRAKTASVYSLACPVTKRFCIFGHTV